MAEHGDHVANAQLIAAAPDLLAACEAAIPRLENAETAAEIAFEKTDETAYYDEQYECQESLFLVRAAIAKAKGTT